MNDRFLLFLLCLSAIVNSFAQLSCSEMQNAINTDLRKLGNSINYIYRGINNPPMIECISVDDNQEIRFIGSNFTLNMNFGLYRVYPPDGILLTYKGTAFFYLIEGSDKYSINDEVIRRIFQIMEESPELIDYEMFQNIINSLYNKRPRWVSVSYAYLNNCPPLKDDYITIITIDEYFKKLRRIFKPIKRK